MTAVTASAYRARRRGSCVSPRFLRLMARKRGREDSIDWEQDAELHLFCAEQLRHIASASRPELRSFWAACSWLEGDVDMELEKGPLAEKIEDTAYSARNICSLSLSLSLSLSRTD